MPGKTKIWPSQFIIQKCQPAIDKSPWVEKITIEKVSDLSNIENGDGNCSLIVTYTVHLYY